MLSLPKSILVSACFHVGLMAVFLVPTRPGGARILYQPEYQVRLVEPSEIPSLGAKQEVPAPKPAPVPPPPPKPPAEKPPAPPPKPPAEKVVHLPEEKEAVKEAVKEPERPPPAPRPERPEEAPPAVAAPEPERVLEDVLARLRKDAETRTPAATGRPSGPAPPGWAARQQQMQAHEYYDQVERHVRSNWIPPKSLEFTKQNIVAVVSLVLLPDGRVLESTIEASSGDPVFDQSVMRAILRSTPLPPPPIGLRQDRYELGLRFHSRPHTR